MQLRLIGLLLSFVCLCAGTAIAKPTYVTIDDLRANDQQRQAALIITQVMEKFHYRKPSLDDDLSTAILDRYLESLDSNRSFFTAQDVARYERYRLKLDDSLRSGKLEPAFEIFRRFRESVDERVAYAETMAEGLTVYEGNDKKAMAEIDAITNELLTWQSEIH